MSWTPASTTSSAWQYATSAGLGLLTYDYGTYDGALILYDYLIGGSVTFPWGDHAGGSAGWGTRSNSSSSWGTVTSSGGSWTGV